MAGRPFRTAELGRPERDRLRAASIDPDSTGVLARYVRLESAVGAAVGLIVALSGGAMAAIAAPSPWWALVPVAVGAALGQGARLRARRWVKTVTASLTRPVCATRGPARFERQPLRHFPHLPGPAYAELSCPAPGRGHLRVPLMGGQRSPASRDQPAVMVTVISKSRRGWPPTALIAGGTVFLASPAPLASHLRHHRRRADRR